MGGVCSSKSKRPAGHYEAKERENPHENQKDTDVLEPTTTKEPPPEAPEEPKIFEDYLMEPAPKYYIGKEKGNSQQLLPRSTNDNENDQNVSLKSWAQKKREEKRKGRIRTTSDFNKIVENVTILRNKTVGTEDLKFIIQTLVHHFAFYNLNEFQMEFIVNRMFYCRADEGQYVFEQGDEEATSFFLFHKGKAIVEIDREAKRQLSLGEAIGELALLYSAPRSASIYAEEESFFWGMDRKTFRKTIDELIESQFSVNRKFLDEISFFNTMTITQKNAIAHALSSQKFQVGQPIVKEGEQASSYYIVQSGEVACIKDNKEIRRLAPGETFGEQALYFNSLRSLTVKAVGKDTTVLALGRVVLTGILGGQVQEIIYKNLQRWAFEKDQLLSRLTKLQIERLIAVASYANKAKGEIILKADERPESLLFLMEGSAFEVKLVKTTRKLIESGFKGNLWDFPDAFLD